MPSLTNARMMFLCACPRRLLPQPVGHPSGFCYCRQLIVLKPPGKLCGASYINERFEQKLLQKLTNETYLVKNGKTLKSIAQAKTTQFENHDKRMANTSVRNDKKVVVYIDDLKENGKKNFKQNRWEPPR